MLNVKNKLKFNLFIKINKILFNRSIERLLKQAHELIKYTWLTCVNLQMHSTSVFNTRFLVHVKHVKGGSVSMGM